MDRKRTGLDATLIALADPIRRDLLRRLLRERLSITELAAPLPLSFEAVSKHLRMLERAQLVQRTRQGRAFYFEVTPEPLNDAAELVNELRMYWTTRLDALARLVETPLEPKGTKPTRPRKG